MATRHLVRTIVLQSLYEWDFYKREPELDLIVERNMEEFGPGTGFRNVLAENKPDSKRLILCSGKIYFELAAERASRGLENAIALARVEQLYPLDHAVLRKLFTVHDASEFIWCQEEPLNMGPFCALDRELSSIAGRPLRYAGRSASASPAVGVHEWHVKERQALLDAALDGL